MRLPPKTEDAPHYRRLRYRLDCGREVEVEGFYVSPSTIGYLEGSKDIFATPIIESSPKEPANNFPGINGLFIKPVPDGELPVYTFMVDLICYQPVSDTDEDMSSLTVCWLGDDIETSLPELIDREIILLNGRVRGGWKLLGKESGIAHGRAVSHTD